MAFTDCCPPLCRASCSIAKDMYAWQTMEVDGWNPATGSAAPSPLEEEEARAAGTATTPQYEELLAQLPPAVHRQIRMAAQTRVNLPRLERDPAELEYDNDRFLPRKEPELDEWGVRAKMEKRKRQQAERDGALPCCLLLCSELLRWTGPVQPAGRVANLSVFVLCLPIFPTACPPGLPALRPQSGTGSGRWWGSTPPWVQTGAATCGARALVTRLPLCTGSGRSARYGTSSRSTAGTQTPGMWHSQLKIQKPSQVGVVGVLSGGPRGGQGRTWQRQPCSREASLAPRCACSIA